VDCIPARSLFQQRCCTLARLRMTTEVIVERDLKSWL
jgi:hypothetical protein